MAVSSQDILNFLLANPNMSDSAIAAAMDMYGVTPAMMAQAVGIPVQQVQQRYEEVQPQGLFTAPEPVYIPEPVYAPAPVYTPNPVYTPAPVYISEPVYIPQTVYAPGYVPPEPIVQPTVTNQQIVDFIVANPTITDTQLAAVMQQYDVSPQQVAQATGTSIEEAVNRYEAVTQPVITPEPVVPPMPPLETPVITPEPQQTQEASNMAITSKQIVDFLVANPGMSDAQIVSAMETYGISPAQMAQAVGLPEGEVVSRVAATIPEGMSVTLGDTNIAPQYQVIGSGEDRQVLGIENIYTTKTNGDPNYKAPVGSEYQVLNPDGTFQSTGTVKKDQSFFGGLVDAFKDPVVLAALGGAAAGGLLGGAGAAGTAGMTTAELAQLDLALGGAGGTAGATALGNALATGAAVPTLTNLTGGSGVLTGAAGGITAESVAAKLAADAAASGTTTGLLTGAPTVIAPTTGALTTTTGALTPTATTAATGALTPAVTSTVSPVVNPVIPAVTGALTGLTTPSALGSLLAQGLTLGGGLLQSQTSKEAAQQAQAMIDRETAAAKQAAAFTPVGMTTRFGSSQFQVDPATGKLTSAGYTLSPEAKAAQDRFVKLAEQGIQQAEGAQQQFAPLQTGAQSLFTLGNQYLAQSPEQVAQNYLNQQMALLQPGRELELANLQNKLQQQGRGGLSVAQGGNLGATTPELQALFNARAQQEALLAAQAQQAGQQQVTFGANLLGTGAQTMGQYYGGQQAAYSPYTTALGQVQALEAAGQQPLTMGAQLGQTAATAGANVGRLGLAGAELSAGLATGQAATNNPYAMLLGGLGASPAFGAAAGNILGGLFS